MRLNQTVRFLKNNTLKGYQKHEICMLKQKNSELIHKNLAKNIMLIIRLFQEF